MTIECAALEERMPAVAAGTDRWTAVEEAHLAACGSCAAEWRLVRTAGDLGVGAASAIDTGRLSRNVLVGVSRRKRVTRWRRAGWLAGLAAAAALILLVWRGREARTDLSGSHPPAEFHIPLAELEPLDDLVLQQLLDGLEAPVSEGSTIDGPSLGDLDDSQLERVLRSLEG